VNRWLGILYVTLAACGSTSAPPKPAPVAVAVQRPPDKVDEHARHEELAAAHRKLEEEQSEALAATCSDAERGEKHERCLPSCYPTEPADARAGKKLGGAVELAHLVCEEAGRETGAGPFAIADEIEPGKLAFRAVRGRFPAAHKKGTWQATVESALTSEQRPKPARGDVIVVSGAWRELVHPLTKTRLRCVTVSHYAKAMRHAVDGCGADGALACEATGNAAARGINVVHYRLAEAQRLQTAGKTTECQQAALEAVAVARGLPRWRQYVTLNIGKWVTHAGYRTRFDGTLDEDTLFATAARLGTEAEAIYVACGGGVGAPTAVAQEQSFHTCW
jgi:hypothetical protein